MNEMYDMSIVTHNFGVMGVLAVIFINVTMLLRAKEIVRYKRVMRLITPINFISIVGVVFTGVVMMAAKHLDFTIENIIMILISIVLIILEAKRAKKLKYASTKTPNVLENFKPYASKLLLSEIVLILLISIWMWM